MFWNKNKSRATSESTVQNVLYQMELGAWAKYIRGFLFVLVALGLMMWYMALQFRGLELAEAMDNAQLARNIWRGQGMTTEFIRPISAWTFRQQPGGSARLTDPSHPKQRALHPDVFNAPLFPYVIAASFKVSAPSFEVKPEKNQPYLKFPADTRIAAVCGMFFLASAGLIYLIARQLFDKRIAFVSVLLFLLSDVLWKYSISGLPTTLLMFTFLCAQACLLNAQFLTSKEGKHLWVWALAAATGLLCGLSLLVQYSAGWLVLPVLIYAGLALGKQRWIAVGLIVVVFVAVISPWLARNNHLTGKWFGLAGYSIDEQSDRFPGDQLERSFPKPSEIPESDAHAIRNKFLSQGRDYVEGAAQKTGTGLALGFFIAGLLYRFKKPEALAFRRFVCAAAILASFVSSFGSMITSPKPFAINPSNLAIVMAPGLLIFATAFFFLLFDRIRLDLPVLRHAAATLFVMLCALPLILSLLPPRRFPIRYPALPYYEPIISIVSKWMQPQEIMMADIPWAVAWYGDRTAVWVPNTIDEFYQINDFNAHVGGLYFTGFSLSTSINDVRQSAIAAQATHAPSWPMFYLYQVPKDFPLTYLPPALAPDMMFFADHPRWEEGEKKP